MPDIRSCFDEAISLHYRHPEHYNLIILSAGPHAGDAQLLRRISKRTTNRRRAKFAKILYIGYNNNVSVLSYGGDWFRLVLVGYRSRVEEAW